MFVLGFCGLLGELRDDLGDVIPGWGALGRPRGRERGGRANLPDVLASWGGRSGQSAAQEASRSGAAARAKRYADCGLEDKCAKPKEKGNYFEHPEMRRKIGSREGVPGATHSNTL